MPATSTDGRRRGRIEERGGSLRVVVYAGQDPVTGKRAYLREVVKGTDKAARKRAEGALNRLLAKVADQRSPESSVTLDHALAEWLRTSEIEDSTRAGYVNYIERYIRPALGRVSVRKIDTHTLERFYAQLRRCRATCNDRPSYDVHGTDKPHECSTERGCKPHHCRPLAASTVRQIHSVISGTLSAAERWSWIGSNPARSARRPRPKPPEPDPPSPAEAAQLAEAAFTMDEDWGVLVWLTMTTGIRRGELCAVRFSRIDLDAELIDIRRNWVDGKEKDTKTHQSRRIALDSETVALLRDHKRRVQARVEALGRTFSDDLFVFSSQRTPDHTEPYSPNAVTQRYKDMAARLGIATHFHALRHYSATELLTAGVDLRTVAGRLGHGGGGATTLRVYAAWVAGADRKAAEILGSRMPRLATPGLT